MSLSLLKRIALHGFGVAGLMLAGESGAQVHSDIAPYLEVEQVLTADLNGDGDVLTYTALAAGVDASASTKRVQAQASYRYERRISWNDDLVDEDIHSGVAQARVQVVPGSVVLDGGALAARARGTSGGPIFGTTSVNDPNAAEVYAAYAGPSITTHAGPVAISASYRLGYVHVDDDNVTINAPRSPATAAYDRYSHSTTHDAALSVGMKPGELPIGWTVGAGYVREDANRLDQKFEGKYVRGDIVVPVTSSLALTGGVGYEKTKASQQDILRTSTGVPVITPGGHLVGDPTRPRLLTYDEDGLFWDAGVIYRPSRRTELQARAGERYGTFSATGSLRHQFNSEWGMSAVVYDSVDSFGRLVVSDLKDVPTNFDPRRNPLGGGFAGGGCLFGGDEPGSGVCFDDSLQSTTGGNFRNRGANLVFSGGRGPWSFDLGAGYSNRRYYAPSLNGNVFTIDRISDESYTLYAGATRKLSRTASFSIDAYAALYDSDFGFDDQSIGTGITASYQQAFLLDRLQFEAAVGLYHTDSGAFDSTFASGLVGLRYTF